jgi:predicted outer membrane protein
MLLASAAIAQQQPQAAPRAGAPRAGQQPGAQQSGAQQSGAQRVTANRVNTGQDNGNRLADRQIADCLAIDNQEEIALARLAASKSKDRAVREFAEMLIQDHGKYLQQLERHGAQVVAFNTAARESGQVPQQTTGQAAQSQLENRSPGQEGLDFLLVKRQIAQMCLENATRGWTEKQGAEADKSYIGHMIGAHEKLIEAQKVLRQYASAELQPVLEQGIQVAESHLQRAKQIMHSEENQPQRAGSQESKTNERREQGENRQQ